MANDPLLDRARDLNASGAAYALVTVVRAIAPTSAYVGAQAIVLADGTQQGWIGGGCTQGVVIGAAQAAIRAGEPRLVRISNDALLPEDDVEQYTMACASNGSIDLFIQPYGAQPVLCVLGNTPAAEEARFLAQRLRIGLADAPGDARIVLVATQGQGDEDALEAALRSPARQVLLIASRRKADRLRSVMRMRRIDDAQLARLQAPAGPDAGAKTPGEIALLAIAGVLGWLRGRGDATAGDSRRETEPPRAAGAVRARHATGAPDGRDAPVHADGGAQAHHAATPQPLGAIPLAEGAFVNPVCGMAVSIANPVHVENYEGVAYYFCCDGCLVTFRQDPAKYAAIHLRR
jgi:xanthine dehydrogenase accessory factor